MIVLREPSTTLAVSDTIPFVSRIFNAHRTVVFSLCSSGTGQNTRNFLFVEDVARAFEVILFKGKVGMVYNIGEQILLSLHSPHQDLFVNRYNYCILCVVPTTLTLQSSLVGV